MLTNRDEILIQRCVDGELNRDERRELLARMDELPEGWKTLACTFMEEQLFADAANESLNAATPRPFASGSDSSSGQKQSWLSSPVTTLVLSLCVAFLGGLLVSGQLGKDGHSSEIAQSEPPESSSGNLESSGNPSRSVTTVANAPYAMRVEPVGADPVELPIYRDTDAFLKQFEEFHRNRIRSPRESQRTLDDGDVEFIRISTGDGRVILLPVPRQGQLQ